MQTIITSKFQITIPKSVREKLKLSINDAIEWRVERGKAVILPAKKPFLQRRNSVKVGSGDIASDIEMARKERAEKVQ